MPQLVLPLPHPDAPRERQLVRRGRAATERPVTCPWLQRRRGPQAAGGRAGHRRRAARSSDPPHLRAHRAATDRGHQPDGGRLNRRGRHGVRRLQRQGRQARTAGAARTRVRGDPGDARRSRAGTRNDDARNSAGSSSSEWSFGTATWRRSSGSRRRARSSRAHRKDSGSGPKGIRTPDLRLERAASWASRRWGRRSPSVASAPVATCPQNPRATQPCRERRMRGRRPAGASRHERRQ